MYVYDDYPLVIKRGNGKPTTCIWLSYKPPCSSQILQLAMFEDFISNTTQLAVDILWLRNPAPIDRWAKSPYTYNLQSHYRLSHSLQCFIGIPVSSPCLVRRFRGSAQVLPLPLCEKAGPTERGLPRWWLSNEKNRARSSQGINKPL